MNTPVYCRIDGRLACFMVDTDDHAIAIKTVRAHLATLGITKRTAVVALIPGGKQQ